MRSAASSYVHRHPRSVNLYYRRTIPPDVREKLGKASWKTSLGTAEYAQALKRARVLAAEHDQLIEKFRAPDPFSTLSPAQQGKINDAGGMDGYLRWLDERARESDSLADEAVSLAEWAASEGPGDEIPDPDWAASKIASLNAEAQAINAHLAREAPILRQLGHEPQQLAPKHPALAQALNAAPHDPNSISLGEVLARWEAAVKPAAPEQYRYPVKLFEDLHGALPVRQISKGFIRDFRDALQRRPRAGSAKWANIPFPLLLKRADIENLPRVSHVTAEKDYRCIKTILSYAVDEGFLDESPADGLKFRAKREKFSAVKSEGKRSITPTELQALLQAADTRWKGKTEDRWFLRLLILSGARPEEIAQLAPSDIVTIENRSCLRLHDEGDNKLKTKSAYRLIPVHPRLLADGFMDFVARQKTRDRLFSGLQPNGRNRRYANIQRRLTALMRNHAKIKDERVTPYSVRHAFKDSMRLIQAPEEIVERIMGHSSPDRAVARGYGDGPPVDVLYEWMSKVDPFDGRRNSGTH